MNICVEVIRTIFFDAAGTLFFLTRTAGHHYALVSREIGLKLNAKKLEQAFHTAWKTMPSRPAISVPREDDNKVWWRDLVRHVLDQVAPSLSELDRDNFFEVAYEHFADAGVWQLYPKCVEVLQQLQPHFQLAVISNFDGRLRFILRHLGIAKYFAHVLSRPELGADKPDTEIYRRALNVMHLEANEVLHVGDDPERDWESSEGSGPVGVSIRSAAKFAPRFARNFNHESTRMNTDPLGGNSLGRPGLEPGTNALKGLFWRRSHHVFTSHRVPMEA